MAKDEKPSMIEDAEEPLIDTTIAIPLRSKRTERQQKKRHLKAAASKQNATLLDLPSELLIDILTLLLPSDIITLLRVNRPLNTFIHQNDVRIGQAINAFRYAVLSKCFPRPVLLENVDKDAHPDFLSEERQSMMNIHKRPYQHIKLPDRKLVCTCLTCMLAWNNLNLIIDFVSWQHNLNNGEPIPMIPRGKSPAWNTKHIAANAAIVLKSLSSVLFYARILQSHLNSTVGSIRRHGMNKGNKRRRFRMEKEDVEARTDAFLERSGPPSLDFPFWRDNYYMLEAYLPNRGWNSEKGGWVYMPADQHVRDVEFVRAWARRREEGRAKVAEEKGLVEAEKNGGEEVRAR